VRELARLAAGERQKEQIVFANEGHLLTVRRDSGTAVAVTLRERTRVRAADIHHPDSCRSLPAREIGRCDGEEERSLVRRQRQIADTFDAIYVLDRKGALLLCSGRCRDEQKEDTGGSFHGPDAIKL